MSIVLSLFQFVVHSLKYVYYYTIISLSRFLFVLYLRRPQSLWYHKQFYWVWGLINRRNQSIRTPKFFAYQGFAAHPQNLYDNSEISVPYTQSVEYLRKFEILEDWVLMSIVIMLRETTTTLTDECNIK